MAVDATLGLGSRLYYSTDGISYNELTDMKSIGSPDDPETNEIEATPVNPTNRAREYLAGLINYGQFEFSQFWTKARFTTLRAQQGVNLYWRVVYPETSKMEFRGILKKVKNNNLETETPISIDCTVKLTGASTFTAAA